MRAATRIGSTRPSGVVVSIAIRPSTSARRSPRVEPVSGGSTGALGEATGGRTTRSTLHGYRR